MNKRPNIFHLAFAAAALMLCVFSASAQNYRNMAARGASNAELQTFYKKVGDALYFLEKTYIDTVNLTEISDEAVSAMMKKLDPHSAFIPAKDVQAMNEPLEGNFDGIGIEFAIINDTLSVQNVINGGPSEKAGLRVGDKIVSVDGESISGQQLDVLKVRKYLRGPKGSKVRLGIFRRGNSEILYYTITRDKIPLNSIDASYLTPDNFLYIKLSRFAATSYDELLEVFNGIDKRPSGVILDLRGNGGGFLIAALKICNEFLYKNELILYTEGLKVPKSAEYADGTGALQDVPTAVLIDENSASASEIVSGALQDWDRAVIIGRKSFGKGLVQQQIPLADGSLMRLTVARYHTPSGRVIQSPYEMGKAQEYYKHFQERFTKGEAFSRDSIHFPDSLKYQTLRLKRTVYGGGGIMPDIFVPADTSYFSPFYLKVVSEGLLTDYVNLYLDKSRTKLLQQYKTSKDFIDRYNVSDSDFDKFLDYCKGKGAQIKDEDLVVSQKEMKRYYKGLLIRTLYGFTDFIKYLNISDAEFIKAVEELRKKK